MHPDTDCGHNGLMESKQTAQSDADQVATDARDPKDVQDTEPTEAPSVEAMAEDLASLDPAAAPPVADRIADQLAKQLNGRSEST